MRDQDDARPVGFILYFGPLYLTAADDAGPAGASMSLVHAIDSGQAALRYPDSDLLPQLLV
jgi:hypothetical protein